ncbi:MAG: type IV pilus twitching motility protein PilT [Chloroflexi bacterium]|nr:type IV pilus twitching motility protein PilT [Chloroflexota bacterium]
MDIFSLLGSAKALGASDLHLVVSSPPMTRIHGALKPMDNMEPLTDEDTAQALQQITTPEQRENFQHRLELDFSYSLPEVGRIRCNAAQERRSVSMVIRLLPSVIPSIQELGLPKVCQELIMKPRGLVVISGPTGSGKSTTLAAMIQYLNANSERRLVTIEDPIEYVYSSNKCTVTQRELGSDTLSFAEALRHVLRQDPDVILVGEMRDTETAAAVLNVAETGHLVLTTGHAPSAAQSIERIMDLFPPHERSLVQGQIASLILGVICQVLVPTVDGSGRTAAVEVMLGIPPVRNLIREGKTHQLPNVIRTQAQLGMITFDQALVNLYHGGEISKENLFAFCNDREEVERLSGDKLAPSPLRL